MDYEKIAKTIAVAVTESVMTAIKNEEDDLSKPKTKSGKIKRKALVKKTGKRKITIANAGIDNSIDELKNKYKIRSVIKVKKKGKKKKKVKYQFIKVELITNKSVFVTGLIYNAWQELKTVTQITLGMGNIAWVSLSDFKSCKEDFKITKKKINKFKNDVAQPPKHVYGDYITHTSTFGEGSQINEKFKVHPAVMDTELDFLIKNGSRNINDIAGD